MRTRFIDWNFKLRFMVIFCLITLTTVSLASLLFYLLTFRELSNNYGEAFFTLQSVKKEIFPLLFASIQSIALLAFAAIAIGVLSLFFSHKIAGPLYRFEKSMEIIGTGDLNHVVVLRAGDQIMELAKIMNKSINSINQKVRNINDVLLRFKSMEEQLKIISERDFQNKEIRDIAEGMSCELAEMKTLLNTIRTAR